MKIAMPFMLIGALGATILVQAASRKLDFSDDAVGQPPKGFEFGIGVWTKADSVTQFDNLTVTTR